MRSPSRIVALLPLVPLLVGGCVHQSVYGPLSAPVAVRQPTIIDSTAVQRQADRPLAEIIASQVPGVRVVRAADGSASLSLRGQGSFYSDGQPLVVIDGLEVDPVQSGGLAMVNPHDIASIQVLKDPAQLSMYGIRGSNGVILITTKHGRR